MCAPWSPSFTCRLRPALPSTCRRSWKASGASPTTCGGAGIPEARVLFSRIDAGAWARYRNPIPVLSGPVAWDQLLENPAFMAEYHDLLEEFDAYMANGSDHWFTRRHGDELEGPIAYFCAEYGFHESLGIYSGGLGVLAGDHMKTASDMALPLIGVGLMYRKGYFRQSIDADGHQEHAYPDYELARLPILRALDRLGEPMTVSVPLPGRDLYAAVWVAQVGRVPVLLLDTDVPDNDDSDRPITHILYVRGREMRLHQELVLGVGGVRALRELDLAPAVWHLNEGHSAFLLAERARELIAGGSTLDDAWYTVRSDACSRSTRPSPPATSASTRNSSGASRSRCSRATAARTPAASRPRPCSTSGSASRATPTQFDMTAFSLRLTRGANAVSLLHSQTANATWQGVVAHDILGITNGIHTPTWVGQPIRDVLERYADANLERMDDMVQKRRFWDRIDRIPNEELWEAHQRQKLELAIFARGRLRNQFARHGEAPSTLEELEEVLDPSILTIGFARRFATYKRAALLFTDIERLARMLWDEERPLQIIFAGKAHPADRPGQGVIQDIFSRSRSPRLRGRVFIMEDYDIRIGRFLVQGVDVWLNNPRRPLEASGTSGMKASANGVPNLSVLDGWWDEGWTGDNGWAIGGRETNPDEGAQDWSDAQDLYRILEQELVPAYYERDATGLPPRWIQLMRNAIASNIWRFSTTRMIHEYVERLYLPAPDSDAVPSTAPYEAAATKAPATS